MRPNPEKETAPRPGLPEQVVRLAVVFTLLIAGLLFARAYTVPARYKDMEHNRRSSIEREVALPTKFAGARICAECHEEVVAEKRNGHHRNLSCETCHGPAEAHVNDVLKVKPEVPRLRSLCQICHAYDLSRPTGFPQINPASHNPLKPCIECHKPHRPEPPETPRECSACHGEIERTKAVSAHAALACTTCHETPEEHRKNPRGTRPSKPEAREFCGKCHQKGAAEKTSPKIDLDTHGEKYLCWECHYPHMPEGK